MIEMYQGDSKILEVTVKDSDGNIVNLTGASARWALGHTAAGPVLASRDTTEGSVTFTDAESGELEVEIQPEDTESLYGTYYHEVEVTDPEGYISTVFSGQLKIKQALIAPASS